MISLNDEMRNFYVKLTLINHQDYARQEAHIRIIDLQFDLGHKGLFV